MASTTAEVLLYFGSDDNGFEGAVNALRFSRSPELTTREIIDLLRPVWGQGYDRGHDDASYR